MARTSVIYRHGMTLVELLVVIIILGLLGVAAAPAINSSSSKNKLRDAASSVSSHIVRAASQAVGRNSGYGAWLESDGNSASSPTFLLRFCPGTVEASGAVTITASSLTAMTATATMTPTYETLTGTSVVPAGALLRISGMPFDYKLVDETTIAFNGSSATCSWPRPSGGYPGAVSVPFTLQLPPMRTSGGKTLLGGNACIDLPQSTIGVSDYSPTVTPLSNDGPFIIAFDSVGRPKNVLFTPPGTSGLPKMVTTDALTPIALLVGLRDQVGVDYQSEPSEDNPGANWQRKDAWWIVIDPRSGGVFQVENYPNAPNRQTAQRFIRQKLLNSNNAN